jgi:hypothetical protein
MSSTPSLQFDQSTGCAASRINLEAERHRYHLPAFQERQAA